eukprot:CAMPEP_0198144948 /NCGR_PEP_ID=MMETSP1443-20131203/19786_1 /TAXON_ID=186043 /ORGANISM="Entomoneis sp., Strain CCMP2396" /LENGTH=577 /DNA_ID=CAMNT_0043808447 /DNA_START=83 /DNA_END=1816 /DNA_ORIENTATION=-
MYRIPFAARRLNGLSLLRAQSSFSRSKSSMAAVDGSSTEQQPSSLTSRPIASAANSPNPVPDFNDFKAAYESKSTGELLRALFCFRVSRVRFLVNNAENLLRISRSVFGGTLTDFVLRNTLFGHFCAGEDEVMIRPVLKSLDSVGIGSILDYAAENDGEPESARVQEFDPAPDSIRRVREYDYESERQCDKHVETFVKCINDVQSLGFEKDGYAAIKVTALGNPKLLARMSQAIMEAHRLFEQFDIDKDGTVSREDFETAYNLLFFSDGETAMKDIFDQFDPNHTGNVDYISWGMTLSPRDLPKIIANCREVGPLALATPTEEEVELIEAMYERSRVLAREAEKCGTRLLIDAEQVRFQPAIDNLVLDLQQRYNSKDRSDYPIIYNTYQCYLKDAKERLNNDVQRAERFDFHFGAKLVRGAYMESERALAETMGYMSPIQDTVEDTHESYNACIDFLLEHSTKSDQKVELMVASHNQRSIELAIEAMNKYGIDRESSTICFAQLFGMTDNLSFNLGKHGYRAYKYVPYGKVHEVMPYLLRRARENSSIVGGAARELCMIKSELRRRRSGLQPKMASA